MGRLAHRVGRENHLGCSGRRSVVGQVKPALLLVGARLHGRGLRRAGEGDHHDQIRVQRIVDDLLLLFRQRHVFSS